MADTLNIGGEPTPVETVAASEIKALDTIVAPWGDVVKVTTANTLRGKVLITGDFKFGPGTVSFPALDPDAPVVRVLPWQGGRVGGRENFHPDGWENPRERTDEEPQHDTRRLTEQERYGVRYSTDEV